MAAAEPLAKGVFASSHPPPMHPGACVSVSLAVGPEGMSEPKREQGDSGTFGSGHPPTLHVVCQQQNQEDGGEWQEAGHWHLSPQRSPCSTSRQHRGSRQGL